MSGLFDPARHEPLRAPAWSGDVARDALARIVDATLAELDPAGRGVHPLDDAPDPEGRRFSLYDGNGGVLWALHHLRRQGAITCDLDLAAWAGGLQAANRATLQGSMHGTASFLLGDVGLWLLQIELAGDDGTIESGLFASVEANRGNPVREALWGSPGTLLAAVHRAERGDDPRWIGLLRDGIEQLWDEMERDPETGTWVWVQDLYGRRVRFIGGGHGLAGNVYPALRARRWVSPERVQGFLARSLETLSATALRGDGGINWHPMIDAARVAGRLPPVQDCHGAPGIVCRFAEAAPRSREWDELLLGAGELTWHAGPLSKGPTLCHGTAGSAYACLKLWARTGDAHWLDRARALTLHAAGQVEAARQRYGRGRLSLWTGDLGVACVLWGCLSGDARLPGFDVF